EVNSSGRLEAREGQGCANQDGVLGHLETRGGFVTGPTQETCGADQERHPERLEPRPSSTNAARPVAGTKVFSWCRGMAAPRAFVVGCVLGECHGKMVTRLE